MNASQVGKLAKIACKNVPTDIGLRVRVLQLLVRVYFHAEWRAETKIARDAAAKERRRKCCGLRGKDSKADVVRLFPQHCRPGQSVGFPQGKSVENLLHGQAQSRRN